MSFSSSCNLSSTIPQMDLVSPDTVSSLIETADIDCLSCTLPEMYGLDSLQWELLDNGDEPSLSDRGSRYEKTDYTTLRYIPRQQLRTCLQCQFPSLANVMRKSPQLFGP